MRLIGVVRLAADRRGSRRDRRPDGGFPARPPTHTPGEFRSSNLPERGHANDQFQSRAAIDGQLLEGTTSPTQPLTALRRRSASYACRMSTARSAELERPTLCGCTKSDLLQVDSCVQRPSDQLKRDRSSTVISSPADCRRRAAPSATGSLCREEDKGANGFALTDSAFTRVHDPRSLQTAC
jgi:hypothetical protein